ncbi:MAG: SLBB domain-containing protein [Armatimonadota bacterium]
MRFYFSRPEQYAVVVLLVAIIGALGVLGVRFRSRARAVPVSVSGTDLLVHVTGAVRKPGVYRCRAGELVFDALAKAGGVREDSALDSLALTAPLENGSRVYVPTTQEVADAAVEENTTDLRVQVAGAVKKPGTYQCTQGDIIADALAKAGGPAADGCPDALNLAAPLTDGCRVYIPTTAEWKKATRAERQHGLYPPPGKPPAAGKAGADEAQEVLPFTISPVEPASPSRGGGSAHEKKPPPPKGKISLNAATFDQLLSVPGIGEVTAKRILDYRKSHGKFTDLAELLNIPRVGPKTYERMVQYLTL